MMIQLPGGICFAHGPYEDMTCPYWPECGELVVKFGPDPKWVKLAEEHRVASVKKQIKELIDTI